MKKKKSCKVVFIGGGSYTWTRRLLGDMLLRDGIDNGEFVLVDTDTAAAEHLREYCRMMNKKLERNWRINASELDDALIGADYVCVSISTGGLKAFEQDYLIPEKYGVFHSTGDTVGPAGISRTLRNVPVFIDIARKMEQICPDAWLIHVTNPLSQLTRAVCKATEIRCIGLCHNYYGTQALITGMLDREFDEFNAVSVGVNHGTWFKEMTIGGESVRPERLTPAAYRAFEDEKGRSPVKTNTADDEVEAAVSPPKSPYPYLFNFELYQKLGYFPVGGPAHVAENLPFFLNSSESIKRYHISRKGVFPWRQTGKNQLKKEIIDVIEGRHPMPDIELSREALSGIIESLHTGRASRHIAAMPNKGQISNLPADTIVETWACFSGGRAEPCVSGDVPSPLLGWMQTVVDEQELTVEAALTGDRGLLRRALLVSPMLQDKDAVEPLMADLLEAHRDFLPRFFDGGKGGPRKKLTSE